MYSAMSWRGCSGVYQRRSRLLLVSSAVVSQLVSPLRLPSFSEHTKAEACSPLMVCIFSCGIGEEDWVKELRQTIKVAADKSTAPLHTYLEVSFTIHVLYISLFCLLAGLLYTFSLPHGLLDSPIPSGCLS